MQLWPDKNLLALPSIPRRTNSHLAVFRHALSTPLTSIQLNLELAAVAEMPYRRTHLVRAQRAAQHLQQLCDGLPSPDQNCSKLFPINQTVQESLDVVQRPWLNFTFRSSLPRKMRLQGSKWLFQEAMICLLNNAAAAYSGKTETGLKTVRIQCHQQNQRLQLSVSDGGCGMNWLHKWRALHWSYSTRKSGVGLGFVQTVIKTHFKGNLKIISQPHKGTTILCQLPLQTATI
jgi:K+-sensing histidine kinase KdpD